MRRGCLKVSLLVGYFFVATIAATSQEVVHAFCGTIRSINSTTKTIAVGTDDGTTRLFNESTKSNVPLDFDKKLRAETISLDTSTKPGVRVIIYYFGSGNVQTAVALENLGIGPFKESSGTVAKFDRHERVLTLKNDSGAEESFQLNPKTVAETPYGAVEGLELDARGGDRVQVTASSVNGNETALFIRTI